MWKRLKSKRADCRGVQNTEKWYRGNVPGKKGESRNEKESLSCLEGEKENIWWHKFKRKHWVEVICAQWSPTVKSLRSCRPMSIKTSFLVYTPTHTDPHAWTHIYRAMTSQEGNVVIYFSRMNCTWRCEETVLHEQETGLKRRWISSKQIA